MRNPTTSGKCTHRLSRTPSWHPWHTLDNLHQGHGARCSLRIVVGHLIWTCSLYLEQLLLHSFLLPNYFHHKHKRMY